MLRGKRPCAVGTKACAVTIPDTFTCSECIKSVPPTPVNAEPSPLNAVAVTTPV